MFAAAQKFLIGTGPGTLGTTLSSNRTRFNLGPDSAFGSRTAGADPSSTTTISYSDAGRSWLLSNQSVCANLSGRFRVGIITLARSSVISCFPAKQWRPVLYDNAYTIREVRRTQPGWPRRSDVLSLSSLPLRHATSCSVPPASVRPAGPVRRSTFAGGSVPRTQAVAAVGTCGRLVRASPGRPSECRL